jgi:hypothetical protein
MKREEHYSLKYQRTKGKEGNLGLEEGTRHGTTGHYTVHEPTLQI